jgi:eukaryotic-like serine/threonine-protein kinase
MNAILPVSVAECVTLHMGDQLGHYQILRTIGHGGMGVVYEALDPRLDRRVALKTLRGPADPAARERFWREARAAARVNHPRVCQLFDVGEHDGELFLAMELLEGEPLSARIAAGALAVADAVQTALAMLSALSELHRVGITHRDLKPSNVFLTPHGVKLLDFGLARPSGALSSEETRLTLPGTILGTPQYMAPERLTAADGDARSDLFAVGVILFEMLTGRPPFGGATVVDLLHAIAYDQPPVLSGSPAVSALDAIVHRALAKRPADRYQSAGEMADALRTILARVETTEVLEVRAVTRLIVLPFRLLRPDEEVDFLAFSLPDSITATLSGLDSLVVRSSMAAARFADADLKTLAADAQVDLALSGTLLRAGPQLRVSAQLTEVPGGTVVWSHTSQVPLGDMLQIHDALTERIVASLAAPLNARDRRRLLKDVPASPLAYEYFLRANKLSVDSREWAVACDLYLKAVEIDPGFAPAWARLGRCYRVLAKYNVLRLGDEGNADVSFERAEQAFRRALDLNPDLSVAHHLYTYLEVERGRATPALVRLLRRMEEHLNDPEWFAGVLHACRYVGLLDASIAAFERVQRLDPGLRTSVAHSYFMAGDYERAIATDNESPPYTSINALVLLGRTPEAAQLTAAAKRRYSDAHLTTEISMLDAMLRGDRAVVRDSAERLLATLFHDPEGWYYWGRMLVYAGEIEMGRDLVVRALDGGYHCYPGVVRDPWLDAVRSDSRFVHALRAAERGHREAAAAFAEAGGPALVGLR